MVATINELEAEPATLPEIEIDGIDAATAAAIWRRIESYTAWRYSPREVIYVAEGIGPWRPRLRPFVIETVEQWQTSSGWELVDLPAEPLGGVELPGNGPFRITCAIGSSMTVPPAVAEAVRRLAFYQLVIVEQDASVSRSEFGVDELTFKSDRATGWTTRAMQLSGAADLLRPYRDLGADLWA